MPYICWSFMVEQAGNLFEKTGVQLHKWNLLKALESVNMSDAVLLIIVIGWQLRLPVMTEH